MTILGAMAQVAQLGGAAPLLLSTFQLTPGMVDTMRNLYRLFEEGWPLAQPSSNKIHGPLKNCTISFGSGKNAAACKQRVDKLRQGYMLLEGLSK